MAKMVKKNIELDKDYIDKATLIFEVCTEKEAFKKEPENAVIDDNIINTHDMSGSGNKT